MLYACEKCERTTAIWQKRCPQCGTNGGLVLESVLRQRKAQKKKAASSTPKVLPRQGSLDIYPDEDLVRTKTGWDQIDDILGGGLPDGKVILLAGPPGIGKSTMLLQLADLLTPCEYYAAEEDATSIATRARRLGLRNLKDIHCIATVSIHRALAVMQASKRKVKLRIVDSLQGFRDISAAEEDATEGPLFRAKKSHTDVLNTAAEFIRVARMTRTSMILVSHVNKEGDMAGLREIEHMGDGFAEFDGIRTDYERTLMFHKSRFGATAGVRAEFWMTKRGLVNKPEDPTLGLKDFIERGLIDPPKRYSKDAPHVSGTMTLKQEVDALSKEGVIEPPKLSEVLRSSRGISGRGRANKRRK